MKSANKIIRPIPGQLGSQRLIACIFQALALSALLLFSTSSGHAQQSEKKAFAFQGRVEQVNTGAKPLTVTNEPIEGWMGTMTMAYAVDKPETVNRVKVGDRITAKVYEGDFTLHDVQVVSAPKTETTRESTKAGMHLEDLEQLALTNEKAKVFIDGKQVVKIIVVPDKLVNIVVR